MEDGKSKVADWERKINSERKSRRLFLKRAKKSYKRWLEEQDSMSIESGSRYNILFPNTEVIHGAIYSGDSKPDIRRRFLDLDATARQVAEMMERALEHSNDLDDTQGKMRFVVDDYLVAGLGLARLKYDFSIEEGIKPRVPVFKKKVDNDSPGEDQFIFEAMPEESDPYEVMYDDIDQDDEGLYTMGQGDQKKLDERVNMEVVPWDRFGWEVMHNWDDVSWIYFHHYITRDEFKRQFSAVDEMHTAFGYTNGGIKEDGDEKGTHAKIYEVWDKVKRRVYIFAEGGDKFLKDIEDPLLLQNFFPCPKPLMANCPSKKLEPTPNYTFYQDQAKELDLVTSRITHLTKALKVTGCYDAAFNEMANLLDASDGQMIPLNDFAQVQGGMQNVFQMVPIGDIIQAVEGLVRQRNEIKQTIYEITGISDILRGATRSSETLGAQQLKQQNAGARTMRKAEDVEKFIRELYRLKAELMVEHFDSKVLTDMTGVEITPEMEKLMKSDNMRCYKIAVETDATVAQDAALEQKNRTQILQAIVQLLTGLSPFVQAGVMPMEIVKELLLFGIKGFKHGRKLENLLEAIGGQEKTQEVPQQGGLQPEAGVPGMDQQNFGQGIQ